MIGGFLAVISNIWAASHTKSWLRILFIAIASLSLLYATSYVWLLFNLDEAAKWSAFMRPVGMIAWFIAWFIPPLIIIKERQNSAQSLVRKVEEIVNGLE